MCLRLACGWAAGGGSVVVCVEAYAGEVADAVGEAVEDDFHGLFAVYREDVA